MQPVGHSSSNGHLGKCQETSSKCVIWDGPDINCLGVNLCKGQSIEVVMYHTAMKLCEVLDALNISVVDLNCLTPPVGVPGPDTPNQLFQLIVDKLCELHQDVINLQNTGTAPIVVPLPDCNQLLLGLANCPPGTTLQYPDPNNPNGPLITQLVLIDPVTNTSPAVAYLAKEICELLCRMGTAESAIVDLQADVQQILNNISGALPSVNVPPCISPLGTLPIADPNDPNAGAIPAIANLLCDIITEITDDPNGGNYPMTTQCENADLSTLLPVGSYPGQVVNDMGDLGVIANPQYLWQVVNNMMIAICDLRNFANIVKTTCCPTLCANITVSIGAVIPGPLPPAAPNRGIVRFFLWGQFLDVVTNNSVNANFGNGFTDFNPYGYAVNGPSLTPPQWDIQFPVNITITDGATPPNVFTNNAFTLDQFAVNNYYQDFNVVAGPTILDITTDYTVQYSVTVAAPDGTFCTFTDSILLATTCDNQPVSAVTVSNISANGFTLSFLQPIVAAGTTLASYTFTIVESGGGQTITIPNVPAGQSEYYIYPSELEYPLSPLPPFPGDAWQLNSQIQEDTQYDVYVTAIYNCGQSNPVAAAAGSFRTLVGLTIDISNLTIGSECVNLASAGTLTLIPPSPLPPGTSITPNFSQPIVFDGISPVSAFVAASPGLQFTYVFETLALNSADWNLNNSNLSNCNAVSGVRCWGETTAAKYYPGLPSTNSFTSPGLVSDFRKMGCYDYLVSNFSGSNGLTLAPGTSAVVTNINDGSGAGITNRNHGTYQYTYNAPANSITMPTTNCGLTIINSAHGINSGVRPNIVIKIIDNNIDQYIQNKWTMWYGMSAAGSAAGSTQSADAVQHTLQVANILSQNAIIPPVNKWSGTGTNASPVGLPIFMRLAIYKWNGSGYNPPIYPTTTVNASVGIIDVTPYWIGLPNISTTGFQINVPAYGLNIGLRDKIQITFTGGVINNASNTDYLPDTPPTGLVNGSIIPSSVTIEQDPFTGIFPDPALITGPYTALGSSPKNPANGVSLTSATAGWTISGLDIRYGVPLNDLGNTPVGSLIKQSYDQTCEFVVSGDMTITWSVG